VPTHVYMYLRGFASVAGGKLLSLVSGEEMSARRLPCVCFIVLILLGICMEAQAGLLGNTPDEEGDQGFFFFFLSINLCV
jgi:hypothetical protein